MEDIVVFLGLYVFSCEFFLMFFVTFEKKPELIYTQLDKAFTGMVVNRTFPSLHWGHDLKLHLQSLYCVFLPRTMLREESKV